MARSIRRKPTRFCYFRKLRYHSNLKFTLHSIQDLEDYGMPIRNRTKTSYSKVTNVWDDIQISYYRGQKWHIQLMNELRELYKDV